MQKTNNPFIYCTAVFLKKFREKLPDFNPFSIFQAPEQNFFKKVNNFSSFTLNNFSTFGFWLYGKQQLQTSFVN